jgi:hypothetical protein
MPSLAMTIELTTNSPQFYIVLPPIRCPTFSELYHCPKKTVSWLISLLSKLPVKEQYREAHTRTKLGRGEGGMNVVNQLDS